MNETPQTSFKLVQETLTSQIQSSNPCGNLGSKCTSKKTSARTSTRSSRVSSPGLKRTDTLSMNAGPKLVISSRQVNEQDDDDDDEALFNDIKTLPPLEYEDPDLQDDSIDEGTYTEEQLTAYYDAVNKLWTPK
jgi:hypothetical protein